MPRINKPRDLRSEILAELSREHTATSLLELGKRLRIKSESADHEHLKQILDRLVDEGAVVKHNRRRYSISRQNTAELVGVLTMHHNHATVRVGKTQETTVQIKRHHLLTALDSDTVRVQMHARSARQKVFGEVVEVINRSELPITGTIEYDGSFYFLVPDDAKYHVDFLVAEKNLGGAKPGQKVVAQFLHWEHANASPEATVQEILGSGGEPSVEFAAILKEFGLPFSFPSDVEHAAAACMPPDGRAVEGRVDIQNKTVITIDPVDARDFDDALSLEEHPNGEVELGVHIADVSHYVPENSIIDEEALRRGTSTYLVDRVVPMLPEALSNHICSLVPNQPRFAYSVFMRFSKTGVLKSYSISETIINSTRRYSYEEAQQVIDAASSTTTQLPEKNRGRATGKKTSKNVASPSVHDALVLKLHSLSGILYRRRIQHGGIDFETQETKYTVDENMRPQPPTIKVRTEATSLVEECMLAANRVVAEHVQKLMKKWRMPQPPPIVYRIHEEPNAEKLASAVTVVRSLGIDVPSGKLTPMQINAVLAKVRDRPERTVVNTLLLRAMAKAVYSEHNVGHFGLGFTDYAHFTSPIRRYPDLFVHRALKEYAKGKPTPQRVAALYGRAGLVSDQSSATERSAIEAERASQKLAQVMIARDHVGEVHPGQISGVTGFGVFITIDVLLCEGLLHIRDLGDDYYYFDEKRFRLVGRKKKKVLQFGTPLQVVITRADIEKRVIDVALAAPKT